MNTNELCNIIKRKELVLQQVISKYKAQKLVDQLYQDLE